MNPAPGHPRVHRCLDFTSDQLADRRRIRTLNAVDVITHECRAIELAPSLPADEDSDMAGARTEGLPFRFRQKRPGPHRNELGYHHRDWSCGWQSPHLRRLHLTSYGTLSGSTAAPSADSSSCALCSRATSVSPCQRHGRRTPVPNPRCGGTRSALPMWAISRCSASRTSTTPAPARPSTWTQGLRSLGLAADRRNFLQSPVLDGSIMTRPSAHGSRIR